MGFYGCKKVVMTGDVSSGGENVKKWGPMSSVVRVVIRLVAFQAATAGIVQAYAGVKGCKIQNQAKAMFTRGGVTELCSRPLHTRARVPSKGD